MKKIAPVFLLLALLASSCETMDHWLFDASDYHLIEPKSDPEEDIIQYWSEYEYDYWDDELEYD